jgi:hypothetical protein
MDGEYLSVTMSLLLPRRPSKCFAIIARAFAIGLHRGNGLKHLCRSGLIMLIVPFLHGCAGAMIAAHAIPQVIGGISMANADDRSPFKIKMPDAQPRTDTELAKLDEQIRLARCGDAKSQFWLASALRNRFNTAPNNIEIYKWFRLSEMGDYAPAGPEVAALEQSMPASEIAQAKQRVEGWAPTAESCNG